MPSQPPRYRPPGWKPGKPWARPGLFVKDKRKRGRAGMRDRAQVLAEEPLCRLCLEMGLEVASDVVDHKIPLAWGGTDDRENKQGLCNPCHDEKSKAERAFTRRRKIEDFD